MDHVTIIDAIRALNSPALYGSGTQEVFPRLLNTPSSRVLALQILILAGLSETLGQSVVLFANQIRPVRFVVSLFISVFLFIAGGFFWYGSISLVSRFLFNHPLHMEKLALGISFSYTPLLFGFLAFIPYFGQRILQLLYVHSFVILTRLLESYMGLPLWQAILCPLVGLILVQILRSTIGRPIIWLSDKLLDLASGKDYHRDLQNALLAAVGLEPSPSATEPKKKEPYG